VSIWVELTGINEDDVVVWAREHCPSFCSWMIYEDQTYLGFESTPTRYRFEFYNEQDAVLFQLRWQGQ
jgi:hypothetical protein